MVRGRISLTHSCDAALRPSLYHPINASKGAYPAPFLFPACYRSRRLCPLSPWERVRVREHIITRRYRIVGSNSAAYSDVRGLDVMARLHRARRECFALDRVSPALRAWASDFGKTQSHQRSSPPLIRPTDVGYLRLTLLSNGTRRWAFGLRRPWLRPKSASNIRVLAPNRVELCSLFPILPMVQRHSLGILPRGLDKRTRLSE